MEVFCTANMMSLYCCSVGMQSFIHCHRDHGRPASSPYWPWPGGCGCAPREGGGLDPVLRVTSLCLFVPPPVVAVTMFSPSMFVATVVALFAGTSLGAWGVPAIPRRHQSNPCLPTSVLTRSTERRAHAICSVFINIYMAMWRVSRGVFSSASPSAWHTLLTRS